MNLWRGNWRQGQWGALAAAAAGLIALVLPWTWGLTHLSYELPFLVRPAVPVEDVVIIAMDEASEERLGTGRWDRWDRRLHARLLGVLKAAGTRAVAFDLVFPRGTNAAASPEANAAFVAAAAAHGKVAVAARPGAAINAEGQSIGSTLWQPFAELAKVTVWGMAEGADDTGTIREHVRDAQFQVPSLAWRVAELTMRPPPGDPFAPRWLNYYGPPDHLRLVSYADVLDPAFPAGATFSNKVVFVGATWGIGFTGGLGTDHHRSPHTLLTGRKMAGVEVCATTYLNLWRGDWLRRPSPGMESLAIVLLGLALGLGLGMLRPGRATLVAAGLALAIPGIAVGMTWQTLWWFPWLVVVAVQLPVALGVSLLGQTLQLQRDKRSLEQTLAMARAGAAPQADSTENASEPMGPRRARPAAVVDRGRAEAPAVAPFSPVHVGSSARPSGPSAAVEDLVRAGAAAAAAAAAGPVGAPVVPDHQLLRRIGRGAYGEVWIGRDIIGTYHAIKVVFRDSFQDLDPYEREFKGISRFTPISRNHPGLVQVLQVGRNDAQGYLYYVMELADDAAEDASGARPARLDPATYVPRTLSGLLRARRRLPIAESVEVALKLAEALEFLHANQLIHRDVKPSNVIFVQGVPKFADIGLVTDMAATDRDVSYLGTKGYIAPEGPGSPAADVYSLGKLIYEMGFGLEVGRFPELPTSVVIDPDESALFGLNHIIMRACEAEPARRYQSAAQLAADLIALRSQWRGGAGGGPG